jgi:hypothetical protein
MFIRNFFFLDTFSYIYIYIYILSPKDFNIVWLRTEEDFLAPKNLLTIGCSIVISENNKYSETTLFVCLFVSCFYSFLPLY